MEFLHRFTTEVPAARVESQVASRALYAQSMKVGESKLNVQLLTKATWRADDLQKTLSVKKAELGSTKPVLEMKEVPVKTKVRECRQPNYDLGSAPAVVGRGEKGSTPFC